jgi:hypothetical protein
MWGVGSHTDDADGAKGPMWLKRLTMPCYLLLTILISLLGICLISPWPVITSHSSTTDP